jgi:short-subunit dehydrogenase
MGDGTGQEGARRPHALITGASSGIGEALSRALAAGGYAVTVCARREEPLRALVDGIRASGGTAAYRVLDVTKDEDVRAVVEQAERELGPVELVVANAGVGGQAPAGKIRSGWIDQMIDVNLKGALYVICAVLPGMLERGRGQVVGVTSLAGYRGLPGSAVYSASKAGLSTFLEGIRAEVRMRGVYVTDVAPGFIATPLTAKNRHPMPFLMDADTAAARIVGAIRERRARYGFPWPMHAAMRLLRGLPIFVYDFAARLVAKKTLRPPAPKEVKPETGEAPK